MSNKLFLIVGSVGAMVLAASACFVEVNDDGGSGGAGGGTSDGGTGGTSSVGNGTGGSGGAGGSVACMGCAAYLTECNSGGCPDMPNFCEGSEALATAAQTCVCAADVCGTECEATCTEAGNDAATCTSCLAAALQSNDLQCVNEGDACFADM